jgi:hypothetical protein
MPLQHYSVLASARCFPRICLTWHEGAASVMAYLQTIQAVVPAHGIRGMRTAEMCNMAVHLKQKKYR